MMMHRIATAGHSLANAVDTIRKAIPIPERGRKLNNDLREFVIE